MSDLFAALQLGSVAAMGWQYLKAHPLKKKLARVLIDGERLHKKMTAELAELEALRTSCREQLREQNARRVHSDALYELLEQFEQGVITAQDLKTRFTHLRAGSR